MVSRTAIEVGVIEAMFPSEKKCRLCNEQHILLD